MSDDGQLRERLRRLEDVEEIRKIYVAYGRRLDDGDADGYAMLFAKEAKLRLGPGMRADGREEIRQVALGMVARAVESSRRTLHLLASPTIEVDGDRATGECMWVALQAAEGEHPIVPHVGRHLDDFVREDGAWRIALRRGRLDLGVV